MNATVSASNRRWFRWLWILAAVIGLTFVWQLTGYKFLGEEIHFNVATGQLRTTRYVVWQSAGESVQPTEYAGVLLKHGFKSSINRDEAWMFVRWRKSGSFVRTYINSYGGNMLNLSRQLVAAIELCHPARDEVSLALAEFQQRAMAVHRATVPYSPLVDEAVSYVQTTNRRWIAEAEKGVNASGPPAGD